MPFQSEFVFADDRLIVVTTSELRYIPNPAGLVDIDDISPPNAPKAPLIPK